MPNPPPSEPSDDLAEDGTLLVEDPRFAIVPEWMIDAEVSDAAFRVYSLLLRYGNGSGSRMPSRRVLAGRLHRSTDSVDRALRELVSHGIVRVERRRRGNVNLTNRYHVRTSAPTPSRERAGAGGRNSAATPREPTEGGRKSAATSESAATRTSAARVAADVRPDREKFTERSSPPPTPSSARVPRQRVEEEVAEFHPTLLTDCGIADIAALADECRRTRLALGRSVTRWAVPCLLAAIQLAVTRGWPASQVRSALLAVAADPSTQSPMRLAEAGPWWDQPDATLADPTEVATAEAFLDEHASRRPIFQAQARTELLDEGCRLTRSAVVVRAAELLRRHLTQPSLTHATEPDHV